MNATKGETTPRMSVKFECRYPETFNCICGYPFLLHLSMLCVSNSSVLTHNHILHVIQYFISKAWVYGYTENIPGKYTVYYRYILKSAVFLRTCPSTVYLWHGIQYTALRLFAARGATHQSARGRIHSIETAEKARSNQ
jgi:hypothetical protein